jgi:protein SCO1/2
MRRRSLVGGGLAVAAAGLLPLRPALAAGRGTSYGAEYFTNAVLTTHEGRKVRFYDDLLRGRRVLINFVFVGCTDVCDSVTANLAAVQDLLGDRVGREITMVSITLQPEFDTPEVLRDYAGRFGIGPGWNFVTGDPGDVEVLRRRLGFADSDPVLDLDIFQHAAMLRMADEPLQRWSMASAQLNPESLVRAINRIFVPPRSS